MEIIFQNIKYEFKDIDFLTPLTIFLPKIENFLLDIDHNLDVENLIKKYSELHKIKNKDITLSQLAKSKLKYKIGYNSYLLFHECFDEFFINYNNDFSVKKSIFPIKKLFLINIFFSFLSDNEIKEVAKCSRVTMIFYMSKIIQNRLTKSIKIININTLKYMRSVEALVMFLGNYTPPGEPYLFNIIPLNQNNFLYVTIFNRNILNITKYENDSLETLLRDRSFSNNLNRISIKKFTDVVICSDEFHNYLCYPSSGREYFNLSNINLKYDYVFEIDREHLGLVFSFNFLEVFNITNLTTEYIIDLFTFKRYNRNDFGKFKVNYPIPTYPNPPVYYFKANHLYLITKCLTVYDIRNNMHVKYFKNIHSMFSINEIYENNLLIESKKKFHIINTKIIKIIRTFEKNDLVKFADFYMQLKFSESCLLSPFKKFSYNEMEKNILLNCPQIPDIYSIREYNENSVSVLSEKFNYLVDLNSYTALGCNIFPKYNFIKSKPEETDYIRKLKNISNLYSFYKRYDIINMSTNIKYYNPYCQETISNDKTLYVYNRSSYKIDLYELPENISDDNYFCFSNADLFYDIFENNIIYEEYFCKEKHYITFYDKNNYHLINSIWIGNSSRIFFNKKGKFIIQKENTLGLFKNFILEKKITDEMKIENFEVLFEDENFLKYSGSKLFYWNTGNNIIKMKEFDERILGVGVDENCLVIVDSKALSIYDGDLNIIKSVKINNIIKNPIFIEVEYPKQIIAFNESYFQILTEVQNEYQPALSLQYNKFYEEFNKINLHKIRKVDRGVYILFLDELAILDVRNYI